ncbi:MAG: hypothetical protein JO079_04195 [Frankiaceae bacterium]|nr:hypothetical protein [Frankiaceae bacterium]
MRKLLFAALSATLLSGVGLATTASAAAHPTTHTEATCMYFQNPTVELVWSKVCHF